MKNATGRPSLGGKRVQIRFKNDKQIEMIRKVVSAINAGSAYGDVTFNSFVSGVAFREAERILKEEEY
tara:strand:- start:49 stop:252 length:204 start_codon:yes stop_codon:yes gene_type:complete